MKKNVIYLCCLLLLVFMVPLPVEGATNPGAAWKSYQQGMEHFEAGFYEAALDAFEKAVKDNPYSAGYHRKHGETLEILEKYEEAADAYEKEAALRRESGEVQAALVQERKAQSLRSEIKIFVQDTGQRAPATAGQLAKYEPAAGLYHGVYVEQDSGVGGNNPGRFNEIIGHDHAIFFNYHRYGNPFPYNWAQLVKEEGAAAHLSMEPRGGLNEIQDDDYLRQFARDAAAAEVPIFLRFASEMNGSWVPWHGDPELYIEKWRLVTNVMRQEAPNVAMVWTPNSVPVATIDDYYPGDAYVDWVGVNLYSVAYFDGDPERPADTVNPLDLIAPVYNMYADRKPIQVSEYGATHYTRATGEDTTNFSITKMLQLYHGTQMLYPRVKNINWFSMNTITDASNPERQLNNFSLTENTNVQAAYRKMLEAPYFLPRVVNGPFAAPAGALGEPSLVPLEEAGTLSGVITLQSWAKTYDPYISRVEYTLNGTQLGTSTHMPYNVSLNSKELLDGNQVLKATAYDSRGRAAAETTVNFRTSGGKARTERTLVLTLDQNEAAVDGAKTSLEMPPRLVGETTLVPLRFVSEQLGAEVTWVAGEITLQHGSQIIVLQDDKSVAVVNGDARPLEQPPLVEEGTTFVPLRFIAENFGANVQYSEGVITIKAPL